MKRWLLRLATVTAVLGVLLAISFGWHPWNDGWTDERIDDFMIGCTEGGAGTETCQCLVREIQERLTYDEFRDASMLVDGGGDAPSEILAARANCDL